MEFIESNNLTEFKKKVKELSFNELIPYYENLLSIPDRAHFLKVCLEEGCSKYYINNDTGKSAINFAAESLHFSNIFLLFYFEKRKKETTDDSKDVVKTETIKEVNGGTPLLSVMEVTKQYKQAKKSGTDNRQSKIDIDHPFQGQTALHYLASKISSKNVGEVGECIKILLRNGASVNKKDKDGKVPLTYVIANEELKQEDKYDVICTLLQGYTTTEDQVVKDAWECIKTKHTHLKRDDLGAILAERKKREETNYVQRYTPKINYLINLMKSSENPDDRNAFNMLQQLLITLSDDSKHELLVLSISHSRKIFLELLKRPCLKPDYVKLAKHIIATVWSGLSEKNRFGEDHVLQRLLESKAGLASDADEEGFSLLDYAALKGNEVAINILLRNGAYMGKRSDYNNLPVMNIRPEVLEKHLDYCIKTDHNKSNKSKVTIDLTNISHPPHVTNVNACKQYNDMTTVVHFKKSKHLQHLLNHPTVSTLLEHKWLKYSKLFYTHFAIYLIFLCLLTTLIMSDFYPIMIKLLCSTITIYLVIKEAVQFKLSPLYYLRSCFQNSLDILLIIFTCLTLISPKIHRNIEAFTLLLAFFKWFLYLSLLPIEWISKPFRMLFTVINTVIKSGVLILVVLLFGLCFNVQFGRETQMDSANNTNTISFDFGNVCSALMKAFIMATGEYDASNINVTSPWDYPLLFIFVIIVGIALFNLLIALALNDIQLIQNQAAVSQAVDRINILNEFDAFFYKRWEFLKFIEKPFDESVQKIVIRLYEYPLNISPLYYPKPWSNTEYSGNTSTSFKPKAEDNSDTTVYKRKITSDHVPPTPSYSLEVIEIVRKIPTNWFTELFKLKYHIDYTTFKRAVEIAEKHFN